MKHETNNDSWNGVVYVIDGKKMTPLMAAEYLMSSGFTVKEAQDYLRSLARDDSVMRSARLSH